MTIPPEEHSERVRLDDEISTFVHNIDALHFSLPIQATMTSAAIPGGAVSFNEFLTKNCEPIKDEPGQFKVEPNQMLEFNRLSSRTLKAAASSRILPQSFVVSLVSQYDSFLGRLLRCIYRSKPELLNQCEKQLTYSQLSEFETLEDAKEHILEKEVEALLRESHAEQFKWMENRFSMTLTKDLPIWPTFIELTERRNLFVHCNGQTSAQYLIVCDRHKVVHENKPQVGDLLGVTKGYFHTTPCIFEIGTKLAYCFGVESSQDRQNADRCLNMLVYDLLVAGRYDLATLLGLFALETLKVYSSDGLRRMMVINLAQAYKWAQDSASATKLLAKEDWSPCSYQFKLAAAVLIDDFEVAGTLMRQIRATGEVAENDYRSWPVFNEFRVSQVFLETFREVFGHDFAQSD